MQAIDTGGCSTIGSWTWVVATALQPALVAKQLKRIFKIDLLRRRDNGEQVFYEEAQERVPVPNALVMEADLDEEHGQHAILADVISHGCVDDNLPPKGTLLGVDDDGKDGGNLDGKDEPALGFLELDQGRGDGDAGTRHAARVAPDHRLNAC